MIRAAQILKQLIAIPTVSGNELPAARFLHDTLKSAGLRPVVSGRNVYCIRGQGDKNLLLNSHTDTVPPSESWSRDPLGGESVDGKIYGLGAADAKSCVAAMLVAFVRARFEEERFSLTFSATCDEERGHEGLGVLLPHLPTPAAAVVGEPTALNFTVAQKGNFYVDLVAKTDGGHASRPHRGVNAVEQVMDDIRRISRLDFQDAHPLLGAPTIVPTRIEGGTAQNVIPPVCTARLDVRSTPAFPNEVLLKRIRSATQSEVLLIHEVCEPMETPVQDPFVTQCRSVRPQARLLGSSGVSDLRFLTGIPGVILGPGSNTLSHRADEYVEMELLEEAVSTYTAIAEHFLSD